MDNTSQTSWYNAFWWLVISYLRTVLTVIKVDANYQTINVIPFNYKHTHFVDIYEPLSNKIPLHSPDLTVFLYLQGVLLKPFWHITWFVLIRHLLPLPLYKYHLPSTCPPVPRTPSSSGPGIIIYFHCSVTEFGALYPCKMMFIPSSCDFPSNRLIDFRLSEIK